MTPSVFVQVRVRLVVKMPRRAAVERPATSTLLDHVVHVVVLRAAQKMVVTIAPGIVTLVPHDFARQEGAFDLLHDPAMQSNRLPVQ